VVGLEESWSVREGWVREKLFKEGRDAEQVVNWLERLVAMNGVEEFLGKMEECSLKVRGAGEFLWRICDEWLICYSKWCWIGGIGVRRERRRMDEMGSGR